MHGRVITRNLLSLLLKLENIILFTYCEKFKCLLWVDSTTYSCTCRVCNAIVVNVGLLYIANCIL